MSRYVLLSWLATNNDPYERERKTRDYVRRKDGSFIPGPTLTLLTDTESPYKGQVTDAVFFRQGGSDATLHTGTYEQLVEVLEELQVPIRVHSEVWSGSDPTDHESIFEFLRVTLPKIRRKFPKQDFLIHISPGTPSMQTIWVLMAETGLIDSPFTVVKSYRMDERRGRPAVVPVKLDLDTFYKRYQQARPLRLSTEEQAIGWKPRYTAPQAIALFREARRVAQLKVPVLILGERGTGKTNLAGWIRQWSPFRKERLDRAWPAIACGQYTSSTMRAELFGYKKGAFTDAKEDRDGLLKQADKDTLFLDEIGDIPRDLQRLLIKALEERRFQPLGSTGFEDTDFRLISATNQEFSALSQRLDADFLDRISPFILRVPPLREMREDIGWLWDEALREAARRAVVEMKWTKMAENHRNQILRTLQTHPLPGNLRDLFRVAWRFLAARVDEYEPQLVEDAVTYALSGLEVTMVTEEDAAHGFARSFAERQPLSEHFFEQSPVDPYPFWEEQQRWFAEEVERVVKIHHLDRKRITSVKERTLREWRRKTADESAE